MGYSCSYKPHRPTGMTLKEMYDRWALGLIRILKKRERQGLYGDEHSFSKDVVVEWLEQIGLKEKFVWKADKVHRDYKWWINERLYQNVWHTRIRKTDDLIEDDDNEYNGLNPFYLPEVVTLDGIGHILTQKRRYINEYKDQRDNKLLAQQKTLEKRCIDGFNFVKQLSSHSPDLLEDKDKDKEIT